VAQLTSNKAVEEAAIAWVLEIERASGRSPVDSRYRGAPADIESPPRLIEAKSFGRSNRGWFLWLETRQYEEATSNSDFYIYVVENVAQGDPALFTLKVLGGAQLQRLISRAKLLCHYEVPWPVSDYDDSGTGIDLVIPGQHEGGRF
jgi:Domain of unknown function (DUF3883)